ncbi:hypothetical protein D3C84_114520 [compost metagenome]
MYDPSALLTSFLVRTTTAVETAPFLTFPFGVASLIDTTILSPTEAYLLLVPPKTRIVKTSLAPVLSATFSLDSCCTIII